MQVTIKEYLIYQEAEILNLYNRVGWTNYTSNPSMLTDNTEKMIQFYQSAGFIMDTDINCRAFLKIY